MSSEHKTWLFWNRLGPRGLLPRECDTKIVAKAWWREMLTSHSQSSLSNATYIFLLSFLLMSIPQRFALMKRWPIFGMALRVATNPPKESSKLINNWIFQSILASSRYINNSLCCKKKTRIQSSWNKTDSKSDPVYWFLATIPVLAMHKRKSFKWMQNI